MFSFSLFKEPTKTAICHQDPLSPQQQTAVAYQNGKRWAPIKRVISPLNWHLQTAVFGIMDVACATGPTLHAGVQKQIEIFYVFFIIYNFLEILHI